MRWRTYSDEFLAFKVLIPTIEIQKEISHFLDLRTEQINRTISKNEKYIEFLKSAKQSLISEAVTGKIDLRDWEIIEQGGAS